MAELRKSLSLPSATGLAITMVVGSGQLVVPGLAYSQSGAGAWYAWLLCSAAIVPVLAVFAALGAQFPGAGGIALFVQKAFSRRAGAATEILILGTIPGGSALLLVAGGYAAAATSSGRTGLMVAAVFTALAAFGIVLAGGRVTGRVSQVLAILLVLVLAAICLLALAFGARAAALPPAPVRLGGILRTASLVFFAFAGWELLSFVSEEYRNPKRDFPLSIAISYAIVVMLYLLIAHAIRRNLSPQGPLVSTAPFAALIATTGMRSSVAIVSVLGYLISLSNVIGILWAFSRLLFASARAGLLPAALAGVAAKTGAPARAVGWTMVLFLAPAVLSMAGVVSIDVLFRLAGACFLTAYVLVALSFLRLGRGAWSRAAAVAAILVSLLILYGFRHLALYPVALFTVSYGLIRPRS